MTRDDYDTWEAELIDLQSQVKALRKAARLASKAISDARKPGPKDCNCVYCKAKRAIEIAMRLSK